MLHKDLSNEHYVQWLDFLAKSETWSRQQIEEYQFKHLQTAIHYAWENTVGYKKLWTRHGVSPASFNSLSDINRFPCVTKEDIRDNLSDFTVKTSYMEYVTTGGSTGIPLGLYRTPQAFGRELASKAHQYYRVGWREGDPQIVFRGLPISTQDKTEFFPEYNELRCSSYYMTPEWLDGFLRKACEYKPLWLRCYPSSGYALAKHIKQSNLRFPQLKGILCASENLYDFQKSYMNETFGCRVFSHYGHYECAVLAGYCEYNDKYHVLPQYGFAQLLDPNGYTITTSGQAGEIVASSFIMDSTLFIRYRTGDIALYASAECSECNRPYQLWNKIEGRTQDYIVTGSGRHISIAAINMHDNIFDELKYFQYYQDTPGTLVFRYISKDDAHPPDTKIIRDKLNAKLEGDIAILFKQVTLDEIKRTPRGKFLFLEQKLDTSVL
jgi:phenylacetate-CoA ligase